MMEGDNKDNDNNSSNKTNKMIILTAIDCIIEKECLCILIHISLRIPRRLKTLKPLPRS